MVRDRIDPDASSEPPQTNGLDRTQDSIGQTTENMRVLDPFASLLS